MERAVSRVNMVHDSYSEVFVVAIPVDWRALGVKARPALEKYLPTVAYRKNMLHEGEALFVWP